MTKFDSVHKAQHYYSHPSKVQAIQISEYLTGNLAAAFKYWWRAGIKTEDTRLLDMEKAQFYVTRERDRDVRATCFPPREMLELLRRVKAHDYNGRYDILEQIALISFSKSQPHFNALIKLIDAEIKALTKTKENENATTTTRSDNPSGGTTESPKQNLEPVRARGKNRSLGIGYVTANPKEESKDPHKSSSGSEKS